LEKWQYPTESGLTQPFVESASGQYTPQWQFDKDASDTFEVQITATVNWGQVVYGDGRFTLIDAGTYSSSTQIAINA
jgi:hypothetical protein